MNAVLMLVAAVNIAAAVYAQRRIPRHTAGAVRARFTRVLLAGVGLAFGYVSARYQTGDPIAAAAAFLAGFGAVHVPAAIILFLKHERSAAKS